MELTINIIIPPSGGADGTLALLYQYFILILNDWGRNISILLYLGCVLIQNIVLKLNNRTTAG